MHVEFQNNCAKGLVGVKKSAKISLHVYCVIPFEIQPTLSSS